MFSHDLHYHLGISFANLEKYDMSIPPLCEAIRLVPKSAHYIHERAKSYLLVGEFEKAVEDFTKVA